MNCYRDLIKAIEEGTVLCSRCTEAIDSVVDDNFLIVLNEMEHHCLNEALSGVVKCSCPCLEDSQ
jgi:hypothetical protein